MRVPRGVALEGVLAEHRAAVHEHGAALDGGGVGLEDGILHEARVPRDERGAPAARQRVVRRERGTSYQTPISEHQRPARAGDVLVEATRGEDDSPARGGDGAALPGRGAVSGEDALVEYHPPEARGANPGCAAVAVLHVVLFERALGERDVVGRSEGDVVYGCGAGDGGARGGELRGGERTVRVDDDNGATRGGGGGGGGRAAVLAALEAHVGEGRLAASLDEDEAAESAAGVEEANAAKVEVAVFGDDEEAAAAHEVDGATAAGVQAGVFARRIRRDGDIALDGVSGGGPGDVVAVEGEGVRHHHARDASVLECVVQLANVAHARLLADVRRAGAVRVRNVVVALPPRRELVPRPGLESTGRHNLGTGAPGVVCARPAGDVPDGRLEVHLRHREGETRERRDEQRRRSDRPRHHRDPRARTIRARLSAIEDATERGQRQFPAERAMLLLPAPACVKTTR